jgi:hypothetical protein
MHSSAMANVLHRNTLAVLSRQKAQPHILVMVAPFALIHTLSQPPAAKLCQSADCLRGTYANWAHSADKPVRLKLLPLAVRQKLKSSVLSLSRLISEA